MVSTAVNGGPPPSEAPEGLPAGNYTLVGWDIDTTGRRLIDDICQIAGYTPTSQFSQYIMPHSNMNPGARRRHNIRIVTIGRYRMLKDNVTNKVLKTKSEISALTEFLDWLEKQKEPSSDGIILIYHESRRVTSPMLLEAMQRYNLLPRFKSLVSGFADGQALAADKCRSTVKSFGLRMMANVLLDIQVELESAAERASSAYQVAHHLSQGEQQELSNEKGDGGPEAYKNMVEIVRAYTRSTDKELTELTKLKSLLGRQNTFRPIFGPLLIYTSREERLRAATLRRLLVEANLDYQQLQDAWNAKQLEGLKTELACLSETANEEQLKELTDILDCHFDPAKEPKGMKPRAPRNKNTKNGVQNKKDNDDDNQQADGGESGTTSPDTGSSGSPVKGPEKSANKPANANGHSPVAETN
ncbi:maternal protein exuperantia [Arctopsyche grandis]|uniref:maternal protein exuperantia n=1 Tax=Arctopsyche grandis TaxID=121162 RepID=UPI00406DA317